MGSPPDAPVQGSRARELAERVGAGAVLETTVARAGSRYILSSRALDPASGEELLAVRTSGGERRLLGAIERLSREMRHRLGEASGSLAESRPLPEVTTASLEALRLYAHAERDFNTDLSRSVNFLQGALELDPAFAMAHRLAAGAAVLQLRFSDADRHIRLAWEHRERLADRERWHVEAVQASEADFDPWRASELYERLLARFPEDVGAARSLGAVRLSWLGDPEGALSAMLHALDLDPEHPGTLANAAQVALVLGRAHQADTLAARAEALGSTDFAARWRVIRAFGEGDRPGVIEACADLIAAALPPQPAADDREFCGSLDVADGDIDRGVPRLEAALQDYVREARHRNVAHVSHALLVADLLAGDSVGARGRLREALDALPAEGFGEPDRSITRTNVRIHAELFGWEDVVARAAAQYPPWPEPDHLLAHGGERLVRAAAAIRRGDGASALSELEGAFPSGVTPFGWRTFDELLRGYAFELLEEYELAAMHFTRAGDRGWAGFAALTKDRIHIPLAREALARVEARVTAGAPE